MMANKEISRTNKPESRLFYGYIVVAVVFFILMVATGVNNSFTLFFKPMLADFNWTRAVTSGAFSISVIISGVLGMAMGLLADRFGPRLVLTLCGLLTGLGYLLMSQVGTLWQLYLFYGVIIGIGTSGTWVPLLSSIARWFVQKRSLMTGIVTTGVGIGTIIAPPLISRSIINYGWRLSYIILGGILLVLIVFAAQFLKRDPARVGQLPYGEKEAKQQVLKSGARDFSLKEAVGTNQFWFAFIMLFCGGFCNLSIGVHLVPHITELGVSTIGAANILAVTGVVSILGNFVLGGAADRIGNRRVFIIAFILTAADLFWLVPAREIWMLYLFAVVYGFIFGGAGAIESPLIAGLFGLSSHGLIFGVVHVGFAIGAASGPFVTGYIYDLTGSYQMAFLVAAAFGIVGLIMAAILRPTKRIGIRI